MSKTVAAQIVISRRILLRVAVAAVVLLVFSVVASGGSKHSTLYNVADVSFGVGVVGLLLLIVLGVVAGVQSRRAQAR
jgi:hypothetical protein